MQSMKLAGGALCAALLAASSATALAADGAATVGAGADYSSGKYGGTQKTEILYVPFTGKYEIGPWAFKLIVPYIEITGPGNVVGAGADRVTLPGGNAARRTESGLGDIVANAFYNVVNERNAPFGLDVGAKAKLGTADRAKGLGTGENDYSVQADIFKPLGEFTAFGSLGYRWYGDPPGVSLRNVPYGSIGASRRMSSETSAGLTYDFRPPITAAGSRISEATGFVSQRLSREWKLQVYAVKGFSNGSPDFGVGALLNYSF
jgi:outer membrane putative beta-barrel porin/alpha-amylase